MPASRRYLKPACLMLLLAFSGSLKAQTADSGEKVYRPSVKIRYSEEEKEAEVARRGAIVDHTQYLFALLSAEMALNKGDITSAIGTYLHVLRETHDPQVAERAMELSISVRAYPVADAVYKKWLETKPEATPEHRRLTWIHALSQGEWDAVLAGMPQVMEEAGEERRPKLFVLLTQMGAANPDLLAKGGDAVAKTVSRYDTLPEALIADLLFHSDAKGKEQAAADLKKLSALDVPPALFAVIDAVARINGEPFKKFFDGAEKQELKREWRLLEVDVLTRSGDYAKANRRLQKLLGDAPSAQLYLQAAGLAKERKSPMNTVLGYIEKAYQSGTDEEKSRAALLASTMLWGEDRYVEAEKWAKKITNREYRFDRAVLLANLAGSQKQWPRVKLLVQQAKKMPEKSGRFFEAKDLDGAYISAVSESQPPAQAVKTLGTLIAQAERDRPGTERNRYLGMLLLQRGLIYSDKLKQNAKAIADFRRNLELNPGSAEAQNSLGYTLLESGTGNVDEAFKLIQSAYRQRPDSVEINDSMGWAYFKKGDAENALPYLEYAYRNKKDPEVAAHLGEAYWALEQKERAREVWREGWQKDPKHAVLAAVLKKYGIVFK